MVHTFASPPRWLMARVRLLQLRNPMLMRCAMATVFIVTLLSTFSFSRSFIGNTSRSSSVVPEAPYAHLVMPALFDRPVDAIIVPGGGSQRGESARSLPIAVRRRLDVAIQRWYEHQDRFPSSPLPVIIVLSAGTVHRPNFINGAGWPVLECTSEAKYVLEVSAEDHKRPIPAALVLRETASLDTIGNAYFTRVVHTEVAGYRKLHVITSDFHLPRTRAIFEFVFAIPNRNAVDDGDQYELTFEAASDEGVEAADLAARRQREHKNLLSFRKLLMTTFSLELSIGQQNDDDTVVVGHMHGALAASTSTDVPGWAIPAAVKKAAAVPSSKVASLKYLHQWLHHEHSAYATSSTMIRRDAVDPSVLNTY